MSEQGDELAAAVARLDELNGLKIADHVEVFDALHTAMQQELSDGHQT